MRLLNSRTEYNRCSLPRLVVEGSFEKAANDEDTEKEEKRNTEPDNEREPAAVRLKSKKKSSSGENSNAAKTNKQTDQPADIRNYFKKQKSDQVQGVT